MCIAFTIAILAFGFSRKRASISIDAFRKEKSTALVVSTMFAIAFNAMGCWVSANTLPASIRALGCWLSSLYTWINSSRACTFPSWYALRSFWILFRKFGSSGSMIDLLPKKFLMVAHPCKSIRHETVMNSSLRIIPP